MLGSRSLLGQGRPSWQCPWEQSPGLAGHTQASHWASQWPQMPGQLGTSRGAEAQAQVLLRACLDLQAALGVLWGVRGEAGEVGEGWRERGLQDCDHPYGHHPPTVTVHAPDPTPSLPCLLPPPPSQPSDPPHGVASDPLPAPLSPLLLDTSSSTVSWPQGLFRWPPHPVG